MEAEKQTNARVFDELSAHDSRIGQELLQQKVTNMINVADKYSYLVLTYCLCWREAVDSCFVCTLLKKEIEGLL